MVLALQVLFLAAVLRMLVVAVVVATQLAAALEALAAVELAA